MSQNFRGMSVSVSASFFWDGAADGGVVVAFESVAFVVVLVRALVRSGGPRDDPNVVGRAVADAAVGSSSASEKNGGEP